MKTDKLSLKGTDWLVVNMEAWVQQMIITGAFL